MAIDNRRRNEQRTLRVSAWRGEQHVAVMSPAPNQNPPSPSTVARELQTLRDRGVRRVVTGALHPGELAPFIENGFTEHDRLHLLRHDLVAIPPAPSTRTRRARRWDRTTVLDIDRRAFEDFWVLDHAGLDDAVGATAVSRFRVTQDRHGPITGYAVTGRSGGRGYLQRLAVDPDHQRRGLGRALIIDSLNWLSRAGCLTVLVNTQVVNESARRLYLACGFEQEPSGLTVLAIDVSDPAESGP